MTVAALQRRALTRTVDAVRSLLAQGEVPASALDGLEGIQSGGLWSERGAVLVATPLAVALADRLPDAAEAAPAVVSLLSDVRAAWLRVLRARFTEMSERGDVAALAEAVTGAGDLAGALVAVEAPSLSPTPFGELERSVLPAAAHEAPAFPVLLRALAATAGMADGAPTPQPLPDIVFDDPSTAWRPGRLLRLPEATDTAPATVVLSGALDGRGGEGDVMRWALHHPWAFLLAQMVFTKEAWEAERVSGGIAFELEPAHLPQFQRPPCVEVVVTRPNGEEVRCGSLGELVRRALAQLGVTLLGHRVTASTLDDRLGLVVDAVQRRGVWRFEHGTGARHPAYAIDPAFSDACYRALGSRAFYRLGSPVTAAVRRAAETWAAERIARAGAGTSGEVAS
ncbi:hypothetical protein D9623_00360 [Azospirillum brasilense]|uniref:Uncharacterized protein n=2 Tax=Azospirillum brasilense TaxID=192 RepID=A0A0P0EQI4_AZOBR|nr:MULTISPECIES: hypothetical protein [Azospirillum]ALJ34262.1 hypothetical protein AMK58_01850 [Azospirillum brasilense]MDW7552749.1 hypothetical protein [Azospirillum brasilense]MDW7592059.1 hypothetical protein [Azospirillum brasilense]MDW7627664.1 hypothetical protein [Azospirillum brasilense]MDX5952867.1 hypothetical protein [Azospirillum brasilense]